MRVHVPGTHPWFAGLAVRDALWDRGYDVRTIGRVTQVSGDTYDVEVS